MSICAPRQRARHAAVAKAGGLALALSMPVLLPPAAAHAQTIDYSALEQLFGEPVTTSATGSPQRVSETPVGMDIITAEDIRRSGATDIPTILSRVASVDVETWSAGGSADVNVRGYDQPYSPRLLVLVNGRQVYLDDYGYTDWNTIPVQLSEIKQIEVVKGPNAALFGFNAVGGVVNIITDNPRYDNTNVATGSVGANGMESGSLVATFHLGDRVRTRLSVGGLRENQWSNSSGALGPTPSLNASKISTNLDTVVELSPKAELRVEGSWSHAVEDQLYPTYTYGATDSLTNSIKATLNFDSKYGLITADAYQNNLQSRGLPAAPGDAPFKNRVIVAQLQDLFKVGSANTFRIGLEYRNNNNNTVTTAGGHIGYNVFAASGMWNWAIDSRLALTAAARYDSLHLFRTGTFPAGYPFTDNAMFSRTIGEPSANVGLTYKATDVDSLRASFARGVQIPNLVQFGAFQVVVNTPSGSLAITGEPNVAPTIITSYEIGYDRDLAQLGAKIGLSVYTEKTDDIQDVLDGQFDVPPSAGVSATQFFAHTASSSRETGVELTAKGQIKGGYHWNVNWTYTDIKDTAKPGYDLVRDRVNYGTLTPADRANVNLGWADAKWSADTYVRYVSPFTNPLRATPFGNYWTLAAHGSYAVTPKLSLGLTVENALEAQQVQSTPLPAARRIFATLSTTW